MHSAKIEVSWISGDHYSIDVRDHRIYVDQPLDAGGEDTAPTPTELFMAALAACTAHYGGRFLKRHGIDRAGLRVISEFEMATAPARVGEVRLTVIAPAAMPADLRPAFRAVVSRCTVHNTLQHAPQVAIDVA